VKAKRWMLQPLVLVLWRLLVLLLYLSQGSLAN
jgi:hypothetical protein